MRISTHKQLEGWNLHWDNRNRGPWELTNTGIEAALGNHKTAIGIYFMGYSNGTHREFKLKYCGKAVDQPLYVRLSQHVKGSHNPHIRQHVRSAEERYPQVWFRFMEFTSKRLAEECEGVVIAALLWGMIKSGTNEGKFKFLGWNKRNEWSQQASIEEE
jgi:hypothetical protein